MPIGGTKASSTRAGSSSRRDLPGGSPVVSGGGDGLDSSVREGAEVTTANYYTYITMSSVILVK
ncbi:hypothetical protein GCM10027615_14330 [Plantactinospora veratri]